MPDYNLGRAHGEIEITADTRGAQEAQAAMAATSAEAAALDASMGKVNEQFDKNREKGALSAEQLVRQRGQVEELRKTYQRYYDDKERATKRAEEAAERYHRAMQNEGEDEKNLNRLRNESMRTLDAAEKLTRRSEEAYERYQNRLEAVSIEVRRFNDAHIEASRGLRNIYRDAQDAGRSLEELGSKLEKVAKILATTGAYGLFGGAAGGGLGLLGGSGLQGLTVGLGGLLEVLKDFSGAMLLVPGVVNGAVLSLGTLAVAFHGIAGELSSLDDPQKFVLGLRELAPAAQQAMIMIQQFSNSFRGARQEVQESLFEPILKDIQPLIQTWLPQLMNAGKQIANEFGQAFHQVFQFFQDPAVVKGFQTFVGNLVQGFQAARGAIQPFLQAWNTLANVGSGVFERLGKAIATVANEFNSWVQNAAQSGQLLRLINAALDGFTQLGHIIRDLGIGIFNIFDVAAKTGGSFLTTIAKIATEFRAWTESVKGQNSLATFFDLLKQSSEAMRPIFHDLGEGIAIIAGTLDRLGLAIAPALNVFFQDFADALRDLSPHIKDAAPAISQFLEAFGSTLVKVVQAIGPQLPVLLQSLSSAFQDLAKFVPPVALALAELMKHITPHEIELIIGFSLAIKGINLALETNPIVLVTTAIIALGVAFAEAYDHSKGFHDAVDGILSTLSHLGEMAANLLSNGWKAVENWFNSLDWHKIGVNLVNDLIEGMASMLGPLGNVALSIVKEIKKPLPGSRAEIGPFSQASPEEMGANLANQYAAGMSSGTGAVGDASSAIAGSASGGLAGGAGTGVGGGGTGGGSGSFTTAGQIGISGKGLAGGSGFDQWVSFITQDMSAWSQIFHGAFDLFQQISSTIVNSIKVIASIWGGGKNPLTQQGGIAGPQALPNQQPIPGANYAPLYGPPPIPGLSILGGPPSNQQNVPGVPAVLPGQTLPVQGPPGPSGAPPPGPAGAPKGPVLGPPGPGQAAPSGGKGGPPAPDDDELTAALKANGSFSPEQIRLIRGFNTVEGPGPGGVPSLGFVSSEIGSYDLQGHVSRLAQQFKDREAVSGPFPTGGSDQDQAAWMARVVGQTGKVDYHGDQQPADYVDRVTNAMQGIPRPAAPPPGAGAGAGGAAYGQQRPGVQQGAEGLKPAAQNISGIIQSLFPQVSTIGGVRPDDLSYHPSGHALDIMIPGDYNSPQGIATGNQMLDFLRQNASSLGISDLIYRAQYYATGQPPTPFQYQGTDPDQRHDTHIHVTTMGPGGGGGEEPTDFQRNINQLVDLPPGYKPPVNPPASTAGDAGAGPGVPQAGTSGSGGGGVNGVGVAGGLLGVAALARLGSRAKTAYLQANFDYYDAKAKLDVIRSLSPAEIAEAGLTDADQITFGEPGGAGIQGLNVDLGGAPGGSAPGSGGGGVGGPGSNVSGITTRTNMLRGLIQQGRLTPQAAAAIDPNLAIDVYHATTPAGAQGIVGQGFQGLPGRQNYFSTSLQNARVNQGFYGSEVVAGRVPISALDPDFISGGVRATNEALSGIPFRQLTPEQIAGGGRGPANIAARVAGGGGPTLGGSGNKPIDVNIAGEGGAPLAPSGLSRALGIGGRALGTAADAAAIPLLINQAGGVISRLPRPAQGPAAIAAPTIIGGGTLAAGSAAGVAALPAIAGAGVLGAVSTATGAASGQEPSIDYTKYPRTGLAPGTGKQWGMPDEGMVSGPGPSPKPAAPTGGTGSFWGIPTGGSTPVHVTNPGDLPGGTHAPPPPTTRPSQTPGVAAGPAQGPVSQQPQPGGGARPQGESVQSTAAAPAQAGGTGATGAPQALPFGGQTPLDSFTGAMAAVGNVAADAFQVFDDIIKNIQAVAAIGDTLVRGPANTEDIVKIIQNLQTFLTTAADVAKTVGAVGSLVGGAGAGDPTGITSAVGSAISSIASIVSSAITAVNQSITLGIEIYHEVGKYAGFIFGGLLGGSLGTLGGNVHMLLNTRTGQIQAYSEDNPLNKNIINTPFSNSYTKPPPAQNQMTQLNMFSGPGTPPMQMFQDSMWIISTGAPQVASVAPGAM